MVATLMHFDS